MAKQKNYLQIFLIMAVFSLLSWFGCKRSLSGGGNSVTHGLFTIKSKTRTSSRFDVNTASRRRNTVTSYQVSFNAKPLPFPEGTAYSSLWKVYILPDAPTPSLLTIGRSAYIWTEKGGDVKGTRVIEAGDDFLTLQQIGSPLAMPTSQWTIYQSDDRDSSLELRGSKYLLIDQEQLLRIADLNLYPIPRKRRLVEDFYPHTYEGAQGLSPDEQQIVMIGSKSDEVHRTRYHYGLIAYNLENGEEYVLQIDPNKTRLPEYKLINPDWFNAYYEWIRLADGGYRLVEKKLDPLPPWQGWFNDPGDKRFSLKPVSEDLLPRFAEFVQQKLSLPPEAIKAEQSESFQYLNFIYEEKRFNMSYWAEGQQLGFSIDLLEKGNERTDEIVSSIGEAFNAELAKGEYLSYFTSL